MANREEVVETIKRLRMLMHAEERHWKAGEEKRRAERDERKAKGEPPPNPTTVFDWDFDTFHGADDLAHVMAADVAGLLDALAAWIVVDGPPSDPAPQP